MTEVSRQRPLQARILQYVRGDCPALVRTADAKLSAKHAATLGLVDSVYRDRVQDALAPNRTSKHGRMKHRNLGIAFELSSTS